MSCRDYPLAACCSRPAYLTQEAWAVDADDGDDGGPGTPAQPLRTLAELARRWAGRVLSPSIATATITLAGTFPTEVFALPDVYIGRGQTVIVRPASLTEVANGTITTYTARVPASNTAATILADISFAGLAQARIRITSGPSAGATAWIGKDLGANTCRVGAFQREGTPLTPANGSTFVVETYPTAVGGVAFAFAGGGVVRVEDLDIRNISIGQGHYLLGSGLGLFGASALFGGGSQLYRCILSGASNSGSRWYYGANFTGCCSTTSLVWAVGQFSLQGHTFFSRWEVRESASVVANGPYLTLESISSGSVALVQLSVGNILYAVDIEVFDCTSRGQGFLLDGSYVGAFDARSVYGSGNTLPSAIQCYSGSSWIYTTKPTITGTVQDTLVGGTAKTWAAIPYVEAANNAMIVAKA